MTKKRKDQLMIVSKLAKINGSILEAQNELESISVLVDLSKEPRIKRTLELLRMQFSHLRDVIRMTYSNQYLRFENIKYKESQSLK